jgi:isopentenyldiphosphate isomerase
LQKRAKNKFWGLNKSNFSAGGGAIATGSYKKCIIRKIEEELGIKLEINRLKELFKIKYFQI